MDGWMNWLVGSPLSLLLAHVFTPALDGDLMCDVTIVRYVANAVLLTCHFRLSVCMYVCLNFCN